MMVGDKVKCRYEDALHNKLLWDGVLKEQRPEGWLVDLGGIAVVFAPENIIEVADGK